MILLCIEKRASELEGASGGQAGQAAAGSRWGLRLKRRAWGPEPGREAGSGVAALGNRAQQRRLRSVGCFGVAPLAVWPATRRECGRSCISTSGLLSGPLKPSRLQSVDFLF